MHELGKGLEFEVHGHDHTITSHSVLQADVSDLPASRKVSGLAGHTSKHFMCPFCEMPFYRLVDPDCYDPSSFKLRDDWRYIKYAFRARDVDAKVAEEIFVKRGV